MIRTTLALLCLAIAGAAHAGDAPAQWWIEYADRQGMFAVSADVKKLGISGAMTTVAIVNREPPPGKPRFMDEQMEFDCFSRQLRLNGGAQVVGSTWSPIKEGTVWESPQAGSNLKSMLSYACGTTGPGKDWIPFQLGLDDLVAFYYTRILGEPVPK